MTENNIIPKIRSWATFQDFANLKIAICEKVKDFYNNFYKNVSCICKSIFLSVKKRSSSNFKKKNNSIVENLVNGTRI